MEEQFQTNWDNRAYGQVPPSSLSDKIKWLLVGIVTTSIVFLTIFVITGGGSRYVPWANDLNQSPPCSSEMPCPSDDSDTDVPAADDAQQPPQQQQPPKQQPKQQVCSVCHGSGSVVCSSCKGEKMKTCWLCKGETMLTMAVPSPYGGMMNVTIPCTNCSGLGTAFCLNCFGVGRTVCKACTPAMPLPYYSYTGGSYAGCSHQQHDCYKCNGTGRCPAPITLHHVCVNGKIRCYICSGTGRAPDPYATGTHRRCSACDGYGYEMCSYCNYGRCAFCNGTGKR